MPQGHNDGDKEKTTRRRTKGKGKLSLKTSSKDYDGNLGLPEKVVQREFETTGQFLKRLDRLVAKAKVEASMETRFDMTLKKDDREKVQNFNKEHRRKQGTRRRKNNNSLEEGGINKRSRKFRKGGKGGGRRQK